MIEAGELDHNRIGNTLIAPKPIVVVDGENFCIFQWTASTSKAFNGQGCYNRLTGLKIKTRDEDIIVSFFDRKIIRQPRSEADKNINFKAYGK